MLHEKWLVETNEMLTLDTKNADPYKSKSTWRMITRTVMEDASMQSIHDSARHSDQCRRHKEEKEKQQSPF
jgi:hypothetical protein